MFWKGILIYIRCSTYMYCTQFCVFCMNVYIQPYDTIVHNTLSNPFYCCHHIQWRGWKHAFTYWLVKKHPRTTKCLKLRLPYLKTRGTCEEWVKIMCFKNGLSWTCVSLFENLKFFIMLARYFYTLSCNRVFCRQCEWYSCIYCIFLYQSFAECKSITWRRRLT